MEIANITDLHNLACTRESLQQIFLIARSDSPDRLEFMQKLVEFVPELSDSDDLRNASQIIAENLQYLKSGGLGALCYLFELSPAGRREIIVSLLKNKSELLILHTLKNLSKIPNACYGKCPEVNWFVDSLENESREYYVANSRHIDVFLDEDEREDSSVLPSPEKQLAKPPLEGSETRDINSELVQLLTQYCAGGEAECLPVCRLIIGNFAEINEELVELLVDLQKEEINQSLLLVDLGKFIRVLPQKDTITALRTNLLFADFQFEEDEQEALKRYQDLFYASFGALLNAPFAAYESCSEIPGNVVSQFLEQLFVKDLIIEVLRFNGLTALERSFFSDVLAILFNYENTDVNQQQASGLTISKPLVSLTINLEQVIEEFKKTSDEMEILNSVYEYLLARNGDVITLLLEDQQLFKMKDSIILFQCKEKNFDTCYLALKQMVQSGQLKIYEIQKLVSTINRYFLNSYMIYMEILLIDDPTIEIANFLIYQVLNCFCNVTDQDPKILIRCKQDVRYECYELLFASCLYLFDEYAQQLDFKEIHYEKIEPKYEFPLYPEEILVDGGQDSTAILSGLTFELSEMKFIEIINDFIVRRRQEECQPEKQNNSEAVNASHEYFIKNKEYSEFSLYTNDEYEELGTEFEKLSFLAELCDYLQESPNLIKFDSILESFFYHNLSKEKSKQCLQELLRTLHLLVVTQPKNKNLVEKQLLPLLFIINSTKNKAVKFSTVECINSCLDINDLLSEKMYVQSNNFAQSLFISLNNEKSQESSLLWIQEYLLPNIQGSDSRPNEFIKKLEKEMKTGAKSSSKYTELYNAIDVFIEKEFSINVSCMSSPSNSRPETPLRMASRSSTPVCRPKKQPPGSKYEGAQVISQEELFLDRILNTNVFSFYNSKHCAELVAEMHEALKSDNIEVLEREITANYRELFIYTDILLYECLSTDLTLEEATALLGLVRTIRLSEYFNNSYLQELEIFALFEALLVIETQSDVMRQVESLKPAISDEFIIFAFTQYSDQFRVNLLYYYGAQIINTKQFAQYMLMELCSVPCTDELTKNDIILKCKQLLAISSENDLECFDAEYIEQLAAMLFPARHYIDDIPELKQKDSEISLALSVLRSKLQLELTSSAVEQIEEENSEINAKAEALFMEMIKIKICNDQFEALTRKVLDERIEYPSEVINEAIVIILPLLYLSSLGNMEIIQLLSKYEFGIQFSNIGDVTRVILDGHNRMVVSQYLIVLLLDTDLEAIVIEVFNAFLSNKNTTEQVCMAKIVLLQVCELEQEESNFMLAQELSNLEQYLLIDKKREIFASLLATYCLPFRAKILAAPEQFADCKDIKSLIM